MAQVRTQVGFGGLIEAVQETGHFYGAVTESSSETVRVCGLWSRAQLVLVPKGVQVSDRQLQDVSLLQFGNVFSFLREEKNKRREIS